MKISKIELSVACESFQDVRDLEDFLLSHGVETDFSGEEYDTTEVYGEVFETPVLPANGKKVLC